MHCWKLPTDFIPMSPPIWSIPHSMTKLWPLGLVYVVASDAGQEMSDGVLLAEVVEVALVVDPLEEDSVVVALDRLVETPDCEDDVPEPSVKSFAPQTAGLFTAEPTAFLR
jgi:hypothetical protein